MLVFSLCNVFLVSPPVPVIQLGFLCVLVPEVSLHSFLQVCLVQWFLVPLVATVLRFSAPLVLIFILIPSLPMFS